MAQPLGKVWWFLLKLNLASSFLAICPREMKMSFHRKIVRECSEQLCLWPPKQGTTMCFYRCLVEHCHTHTWRTHSCKKEPMPDTYNGLDALQGIVTWTRHLKGYKLWFYLYNTLGMTKLQQWRADSWLPGVKDWVQTDIREHTTACGDGAAVSCWWQQWTDPLQL